MSELLKLEGTRIIFRNLAGKPDKFNPRGGNRSFSVIIPDLELANQLKLDGWNIKYLTPRDETEEPTAHLPIKVSYSNRPPKIYIVSGRNKTLLNEKTIESLDYADIENVDITITPYNYSVNGHEGIAAYVKNMYVNIIVDDFESKYSFDEEESSDEMPWD